MPTITPRQLDQYTVQLVDIYARLEQDVFLKMAEILKTGDKEDKEYALQWQVEKMQQLRIFNLETIRMLSEITGITTDEIIRTLNAAGFDTIETVDEQVKRLGKNVLEKPTEIDSLLRSYINQTFNDIDNFVNLSLIDTQQSQGTATGLFKRIIEETVANVIVGNKTINQSLVETVIKWREKGIPSGFLDKGGKRWSIRNYVEMAMRTTTNNVYNQFTEDRMSVYNIHLVRIDWYRGARPACAKIQGGVASLRRNNTEGYPSVYDFKYKEPSGLRGISCRHKFTPFVEGVSTNNNHPPDVTEANEYYKKMQKQRSLEREVRKAKENLGIAKIIGDDEAINKWKEKISIRQAKVREYVEENDLVRRYDKERLI